MNNFDDVYEYYKGKFRDSTLWVDKADYDSLKIGMYLALAAVAKAAMTSSHVDVGYLYDLEQSAEYEIEKAYEDGLLNE